MWLILLAPALLTWRTAEAEALRLDAQLQKMQSLQAQARTLQSQPRLGTGEALRMLEAALKQQLGSAAQLDVSAERATVTLKGASAEALLQWLTQIRINAHLLPVEARLIRSASVTAGWDGTIVLGLPTR